MKAQGISINVIVIAAIALLILVILTVITVQKFGEVQEGFECENYGGKCAKSCSDSYPYYAPSYTCDNDVEGNKLRCCFASQPDDENQQNGNGIVN